MEVKADAWMRYWDPAGAAPQQPAHEQWQQDLRDTARQHLREQDPIQFLVWCTHPLVLV